MDVQAGWYPDPASPSSARWWDGTRWTEHTTPLDRLGPGQPTLVVPTPDAQPTVVLPSPGSQHTVLAGDEPPAEPTFVAPLSPVPGFGLDGQDTATYPWAPAYGADGPATPPRRGVGWGVIALVGVLALVLVAAAALAVRGVSSGSGSAAAPAGPPLATPGGGVPSSAAPSATGGTTTPATAAQAAAVLETFQPTAADLPSGVTATLIPHGDVAAGQKTLDGWCSNSYATEKDRIARRQWDLQSAGQPVGLSIEVVAYATAGQAAAARAEFTDATRACHQVALTVDGTSLTQDLVTSSALAGLPPGIAGYRGVVDVVGKSTSGTAFTGTSSGTVQQKGQYLSIVWTNQATAITPGDQQVIDRFVAQQTSVLASTTS